MAFSFARRLHDNDPKHLLIQIVRRTVILFSIGLLLNLLFAWADSSIRILGVLQRIALCYFFVSLMVLKLKPAGLWIMGISLLILYSIGMLLIPVPNYGAGVFLPEGSFCWWLDSMILHGYTWMYAPAAGFDPEGIWSTLPAIVTTLIGFNTGQLLHSDRTENEKLIGLFTRGNVCLLLSFITLAFMPINKQLWTVPYVFLTAGLACHVLGMLYLWIDCRKHHWGLTPALIYGTNAIFVYVVSDLIAFLLAVIQIPGGEATTDLKQYLYEHLYVSWASPINASLAMSLSNVLVCLAITYFLYRKRIWIKI